MNTIQHRSLLVALALGSTIASAVACHGVTNVDAPDVVQPSSLDNQQGALALQIAALSRFYVTVSSQANSTAAMTDEWISGFFISNEDSRLGSAAVSVLTSVGAGVHLNGQQARVNALQAIATTQKY